MRRSIQRELNDFFGRISDSDYSIQHVTKCAFSQACSKLKPATFIELSSIVVIYFYSNAPYLIWGTYMLLACDGRTVMLPASKSNSTEFESTARLLACDGRTVMLPESKSNSKEFEPTARLLACDGRTVMLPESKSNSK